MKLRHQQNQRQQLLLQLQSQLQQSEKLFDDPQLIEEITGFREYCEIKNYNFCTHDMLGYFTNIWDHFAQYNDEQNQLDLISELMQERMGIVQTDILNNRIAIIRPQYISPFDFENDNKQFQLHALKRRQENIKNKLSRINQQLSNNKDNNSNDNNNNNSTSRLQDTKNIYESLYSEQKLKAAEQYAKKLRKQQIARKKKLEELQIKQKQAEQKQLEQTKEQEQKRIQSRKQLVVQKQNLYHQHRDQQKMLREQRKTQYIKIKKSLQEKPPLFKKIQQSYSKRYEDDETGKRNKMNSERKQYLEHVNSTEIQKHHKQYEEMLKKRDQQRKQRILLMSQEEKSRFKYHSSFDLGQKQIDPKDVQRQKAKQFRQKVRQYKSLVKQKFRPKVDDSKRKQLMCLIQQMQLSHKRVKRTRLENGAILVEQLRQVDPKMIGMGYLELTKQMAAKSRAIKKEQSEKLQPLHNKIGNASTSKPINYLEQVRKNRTRSQKLSFVDNKNLSYDQKVKKVLQQSERIADSAKKSEMMLKFGKFKTSQQILACKDQIDQKYIDIVNMKLMLIVNQNEKSEDSDE